MENNELQHHGVLGMKWGVRRTPAQLGHKPTERDKAKRKAKRIAAKASRDAKKIIEKSKADAIINKAQKKADDKRSKANDTAKKILGKYGKKDEVDSASTVETKKKPKTKTIEEMSDDEIRAKINRLQLEAQLNALQPKQVSAGKRFVDATLHKVVLPAAESAGKDILTKALKKGGSELLGLEDGNLDPMAKLEKAAKEAELNKKILDYETARDKRANEQRTARERDEAAAERAREERRTAAAQERSEQRAERAERQAQREAQRAERRAERRAQREAQAAERENRRAREEAAAEAERRVRAGQDYWDSLLRQEEELLRRLGGNP